MSDLQGVFPSLVTPFTPVNSVAISELRRLVRFAIDSGANGILCTALAGEVDQLNGQERSSVVAAVLEESAGRVPVVVGLGTGSIRELKAAARFAVGEGAAAVLLVPPDAHDGSVVDRIAELAADIQIPIMLQDAPMYIGRSLGLDTLSRVVEHVPSILHLKIEGGPRAIHDARDTLGESVRVWGGDGGKFTLDCLRAGATGIMPGVELVDHLLAVAAAEKGGAPDVADRMMAAILPLIVFEMQSLPTYVASAKALLVYRGLLVDDGSRLRGAALSVAMRRALERHLRSAGIETHLTTTREPDGELVSPHRLEQTPDFEA